MDETKMFRGRLGVRKLTVIGMLSAISIVLGLTGWGYIKLPFIEATIMHVPVIIGAIIEGPLVGACIGLIFGISSMVQTIMSPTILSFAIINPLVSVLPRILIGITSYYAFKLCFVKNKTFKIAFAAVIGSITNTIGFLGMIYILYLHQYVSKMKLSEGAGRKLILGTAVFNGGPEAVVAAFITVPVVLAVLKVRRR